MRITEQVDKSERRILVNKNVDELGKLGERFMVRSRAGMRLADFYGGVSVKQEIVHPLLAFITHPIATTKLFLPR